MSAYWAHLRTDFSVVAVYRGRLLRAGHQDPGHTVIFPPVRILPCWMETLFLVSVYTSNINSTKCFTSEKKNSYLLAAFHATHFFLILFSSPCLFTCSPVPSPRMALTTAWMPLGCIRRSESSWPQRCRSQAGVDPRAALLIEPLELFPDSGWKEGQYILTGGWLMWEIWSNPEDGVNWQAKFCTSLFHPHPHLNQTIWTISNICDTIVNWQMWKSNFKYSVD